MRKALAMIITCAALSATLCACGNKTPDSPELSELHGDTRTNPIAENIFKTVEVEGGVKITSCIGNSPEVVIPETIDGKTVVSIRSMRFDVEEITRLYIPASVVEINDFMGAFYIYSESFAEVEVAADNPALYSKDGVCTARITSCCAIRAGKQTKASRFPRALPR